MWISHTNFFRIVIVHKPEINSEKKCDLPFWLRLQLFQIFFSYNFIASLRCWKLLLLTMKCDEILSIESRELNTHFLRDYDTPFFFHQWYNIPVGTGGFWLRKNRQKRFWSLDWDKFRKTPFNNKWHCDYATATWMSILLEISTSNELISIIAQCLVK